MTPLAVLAQLRHSTNHSRCIPHPLLPFAAALSAARHPPHCTPDAPSYFLCAHWFEAQIERKGCACFDPKIQSKWPPTDCRPVHFLALRQPLGHGEGLRIASQSGPRWEPPMGDGLGIPRILIAASKPWPGRSLLSAQVLHRPIAPLCPLEHHPYRLVTSVPPPSDIQDFTAPLVPLLIPPPSTVALLGSCVKGAPGGTMATAVATKPAETAAYTDAWAALEAQVGALKGNHLRDLLQYVFLLLFLSEP